MNALCCFGVFPQKSCLHVLIKSIEKPFKHLLSQHENRNAFWISSASVFVLDLFGLAGLLSPEKKHQNRI